MSSSRSSTPSSLGLGKARQKWTTENDRVLINAVAQAAAQGTSINWHKIASCLPGRTNKNCRKRWHYKLAHDFRKGVWTAEEDERLRAAVQKHGMKWRKVSQDVKTRNGDQCWKRWNDCLKPEINHSPWSAQEDAVLLQQVEELGTAWSEIVSHYLPGRTALAAKNRYVVLERRGESSPGIRVTSVEDSVQTENSFDKTSSTVTTPPPPPAFYTVTAAAQQQQQQQQQMAPLEDNSCVTDGNLLAWNWYDASLSVGNLLDMQQVTQKNTQWTPDPFSNILCRNYMTGLYPAAELSNQALALSTIDLPPNHLGATAGFDHLETLGFDSAGSDGFCPIRGSYFGLPDTISIHSNNESTNNQQQYHHHLLDMGVFLESTNIIMPQANNPPQSQDCRNITHHSLGFYEGF